MTVLGIMKNLFKKKFRVYRDDLQKLMQSISIEKVKDVLKNGPRKLKESVQKSLEKTSEKNWYYKAAKSCEKVNDAVLREDKGFTRRATKAFAGKVGAAGASAGMFSMALGTTERIPIIFAVLSPLIILSIINSLMLLNINEK